MNGLRFMNRIEPGECLDLDNDLSVNNEVSPVLANQFAFVYNR